MRLPASRASERRRGLPAHHRRPPARRVLAGPAPRRPRAAQRLRPAGGTSELPRRGAERTAPSCTRQSGRAEIRCKREPRPGRRHSAEREAVRLGAGVEELDLEQPLGDRARLADQLVGPLRRRAIPPPSASTSTPCAVAGRLAVEEHPERDRRPARRRSHDEVDVARVEAERDPRRGSIETPAWRATVQVPASAHSLRRSGGERVDVRPRRTTRRRSWAKPLLWPYPTYVSGDRSVRQSAATSSPRGLDRDEVLRRRPRAPASHQQLLDDHLGHRVLALAEVVEADASLARRRCRPPARSGSRTPARRRSRLSIAIGYVDAAARATGR